jgi:hypothetical protein
LHDSQLDQAASGPRRMDHRKLVPHSQRDLSRKYATLHTNDVSGIYAIWAGRSDPLMDRRYHCVVFVIPSAVQQRVHMWRVGVLNADSPARFSVNSFEEADDFERTSRRDFRKF